MIVTQINYKVLLFLLSSFFLILADTLPEGCGTGQKLLFYKAAPSVDSIIRLGFSNGFYDALNSPLKEIGYCPVFFDKNIHNDSIYNNIPMLYVATINTDTIIDLDNNLVGDSTSIETIRNSTLIVILIEKGDLKADIPAKSTLNPLISLFFNPKEISTFESVAVRKTIENLRTQYVCHLRLQSDPVGIHIKTNTGLDGITPLEWVIPVGDLVIEGSKKKYLPLVKTLDLHNPGIHTYFIEMHKRQFYNSKFIYPTVAFGISTILLYAGERYFYSEYLNLGKKEYYNFPEKFENTFNKAKWCEYAAISALALTGFSFTLCLIF